MTARLVICCVASLCFFLEDVSAVSTMCDPSSPTLAVNGMACGAIKPLAEVNSASIPSITYSAAEVGQKYVVIMDDPDAFQSSTALYWLHWMQKDIEADDLAQGVQPPESSAVVSYTPPTPPAGSGNHRYQFTLYKQPASGTLPVAPRSLFNHDDYIAANNLGTAVATFEYITSN